MHRRRIHPKNSPVIEGASYGGEACVKSPLKLQLVELLIHCRELQPEKEGAAVNAMCVLLRRQYGQWKETARTEIINNDPSPMFCQSFTLEHHSEVSDELLRFEVFHCDVESREQFRRPLIGRTEARLSDLLDTSGQVLMTSLSLADAGYPRPRGYINVTSEIIRPTKGKVLLHLGANRIKRKGILSKDKPHAFLEVSRSVNAVHYHPIYRTTVCWKTSEPRWKPFEISLERLCNSERKRSIALKVSHAAKDGSYLIGEVETSLERLQEVAGSKSRSMVLRKSVTNITDKSSLKEKGVLKLYDFLVDYHYTFMDFFRGGCRCNLFVGVDFTYSNGQLDQPRSLHCKDSGIYKISFEAVLKAFTPYLNSPEIRAFGFGAKLPGVAVPNHCFPVYKNETPLKSYEDFMEGYFSTAAKVTYSGPTYACPLLKKVGEIIGSETPTQASQFYNFLIMFTDGVLNDLEEFKRLTTELHALPLTVLIVGVGPMDLSSLECFDSTVADGAATRLEREKQKFRSNTHFFHIKSKVPGNKKMVSEGFSAVTSQMVAFMRAAGITPADPIFKAVEGIARSGELKELRESFRRRESVKLTCSSPRQRIPCPTCGHIFEESTDH